LSACTARLACVYASITWKMVDMPRARTTTVRTSRATSPGKHTVAARARAARAASTKTRKRTTMSPEHKAALATGRAEGRAVRNYLEALEKHRPRRGRRRTPDMISRRLSVIEEKLPSADALSRLHLLKEKEDLEAELARARSSDDLAALEKSFVRVARGYGQRKGITYSVWRAAGVGPVVLQRAGVIRGGGRSRP